MIVVHVASVGHSQIRTYLCRLAGEMIGKANHICASRGIDAAAAQALVAISLEGSVG